MKRKQEEARSRKRLKEAIQKAEEILEPEPKFIVTPYEHSHFKDWYNDLDPELKRLLEQKGMPTEVFLEKLWVSGFRAGRDNAPHEPMRIGPPSPNFQ